jgi:hypothetical protein
MKRDPWGDDPDRTTRRETLTEAEFFAELDLLALAYVVDVVRDPKEARP